MTTSPIRTVLISEPQDIDNRVPFLPYMWAVLKSYWERHGEGADHIRWLPPIGENDDATRLLDRYRESCIDVLGLSCYTWNWKVQCEIAAEAKARYPECLVVAGGPEPDYKDREFFRKYPYIDAIAVKDGEITFNRILSKLIRGDRNLRDVRGLRLPGPPGGDHINTGAPEVPTVFDYSPYLDQAAFYDELVKDRPPGSFQAVFETNRGCPYACSYCDWGSNTMSKVRRFDMSRIEPETDFFGRMQLMLLFQADANFGILPRDLEIADMLNAARAKYGYPRNIYYSAAKNQPHRVVPIAKKFAASGLAPFHVLAVQHTSKEVLAASDRSNISAEKQVEVVKELMKDEIPIDVQLIQGIPGDSYELWKACFSDLMEWGIHEHYYVFPYHLLPNAPAAEKSFIERWEVETIERFIFDSTRKAKEVDHLMARKRREKIIVKSKTYSREDWVRMSTWTALVKALHHCSLTQRIAVYLRLTHDVPYADFYQGLIEDFLPSSNVVGLVYQRVLEHYEHFLEDQDGTDHLEVEELPGLSVELEGSRWAYVALCRRLEEFFEVLRTYLQGRYPKVANLDSVIDYQKNLVILPSYDRDVGKVFPTHHNWLAYFERAKGRTGSEPLPEPENVPGAVVEATDKTCGERSRSASHYMTHPLDWNSSDEQERWLTWVDRIVAGRSSAAMHNHQELALQRSSHLAKSA